MQNCTIAKLFEMLRYNIQLYLLYLEHTVDNSTQALHRKLL